MISGVLNLLLVILLTNAMTSLPLIYYANAQAAMAEKQRIERAAQLAVIERQAKEAQQAKAGKKKRQRE